MCGIFGITGAKNASYLTYLGLHNLNHRGQESTGIATVSRNKLHLINKMGLVDEVYDDDILSSLEGDMAIGHNRYSTSGASQIKNAQPLRVTIGNGEHIALAHNGNITNAIDLREKLKENNYSFKGTTDSEVIAKLISFYVLSERISLDESIEKVMNELDGAFSILILSKDAMYAIRDKNGFRPLALGYRLENNAQVVASETSAFSIIEAKYENDIEPGSIMKFQNGMRNVTYLKDERKQTSCIFEHIYFSRPDSKIFKQSVYTIRHNLGKKLYEEHPVEADIVVPAPDGSNVAALGFSEASGIPYQIGLVRSHYAGRTFIEPTQKIRDLKVKMKYNAVDSVIKGKKVVLIDDSIVRGTTARKIVKMIRDAGAKEVHLRISSPPVKHPCYYGIDIPTDKELIANEYSIEVMEDILGVDSLAYLSENSLKEVATDKICTACFSGKYPTKIDKKVQEKQALKN